MRLERRWTAQVPGQPVRLARTASELFVALGEGLVQVRSLVSGELLRETLVHPPGLLTAALSPDGTSVATGGLDGELVVSTTAGESVARVPMSSWVERVEWLGRRVVASAANELVVLDPDGRVRRNRWPGSVMALATFARGARAALAVATRGMVHVSSPNDFDDRRSYSVRATARALAFDPTGHVLVGGTQEQSLFCLRVEDGATSWLGGYVRPVRHLAFAAEGHRVATSGFDFAVVWTFSDGTAWSAEPTLLGTGGEPVLHVAFASTTPLRPSHLFTRVASLNGASTPDPTTPPRPSHLFTTTKAGSLFAHAADPDTGQFTDQGHGQRIVLGDLPTDLVVLDGSPFVVAGTAQGALHCVVAE